MIFPGWVIEHIQRFVAPYTGKVTISLEFYNGGITRMEIGPTLRYTSKNSVEERENSEMKTTQSFSK